MSLWGRSIYFVKLLKAPSMECALPTTNSVGLGDLRINEGHIEVHNVRRLLHKDG